MRHYKPTVFIIDPLLPPSCYSLELPPRRVPVVDRRRRKPTAQHPRPHGPAPVLPLLGRAEAPRARAGPDVRPREPGLRGPRVDQPPRVGIAAPRMSNTRPQVLPLRDAVVVRVPQQVGGLAGGDEAAAGLGDAAHLAQGGDGVGDVLQHLVHVDDVEGAVGEVEVVDVAVAEVDVGDAGLGGVGAGLGEGGGDGLDPRDVAVGHAPREIDADRARATADVENRHVGLDVGEEVGG